MSNRKFQPFPVLKTERLTLRQLVSTDDNEIFALRSNEEVNQYLNRKPSRSIEDARAFIEVIHQNIESNNAIYWAIALNGTDGLIGTVCLFNFSEDNSKAEIGYELLPYYQGRGVMQEAVSKAIEFGFQQIGLDSIEAYTHSENQSSTRLLEKLNFKKNRPVEGAYVVFTLAANHL